MNGSPKISFRYLAMMNIWEARENKEKKIIPHCKLIQALLRWNGVIGDDDVFTKKHHTSFRLEKLSTQAWQYYYNDRVHRLIDRATGRIWDAEKEGARPLQPGERDEFRSATRAQNVGGNMVIDEEEVDEEDDDQPIGQLIGRRHRGESSSRGTHVRDTRDTTHGVNDEGLERIVQIARPDAWRDWPPYAQATFDQGTRNAELQRREIQRMYDRSEHWNRLHAYNFQREINHSFDDDQQRRMHAAWHAGESVVQHPPVIDYTAIDPYDGSVRYPQPQAHHSEWIDPYQDAAHRAGKGASSSSTYDFGELREIMESIFGPPQPRYY